MYIEKEGNMRKNKKVIVFILLMFGGIVAIIGQKIYKKYSRTWQEAYMDVLTNEKLDDGTQFESRYFALFDIDKDNVPELFLPRCEWYNEKWYRIEDDGGMLWLDGGIIAKYVDGQVTLLFESRNMNELFYGLESEELIIWFPNNSGMGVSTCEMVDNTLRERSYIWADYGIYEDESEAAYYIKKTYNEFGEILETERIMEDYPNTMYCITEQYVGIAPYYELTKENCQKVFETYQNAEQ